jgi:hypothetical protein
MRRLIVAAALLVVGASFAAAAPPEGVTPEVAAWWPKSGEPSVGEVRDGYLVWNGKPFFRNLHHGWSLWSHKRADIFKVYRYYLLTNVTSIGAEAKSGAVSLQTNGIAGGLKDAIVTHRFREATRCYDMKVLVSMYLNSLQYGIPKELAGTPREDLFDPFNVFITGAAQKFAFVWKNHPALGGYEISEEYWLPGYHKGSFFPPDSHYARWLQKKYGTVAKLNSERGEKYASFAEVPIPAAAVSQASRPNEMDYADFLMEDNARRLQVIYDALKREDPKTPVAAAKGEFGRATWYYAPPCDLYGWYCSVPAGYGISNAIPRAAADHFGKVFEVIHVDYCRYAKRDQAWGPGEKPGTGYGVLGYAHTITEIFEGMKDQWLEDYNDGSFHYFHPTKMIKEKGEIRTWSGQKLFFHSDVDKMPDVFVEPSTLGMSSAFAWAQRAAPMFLPAKVEKGNLAVLMTRRSFQSSDLAGIWRETPQALRRLHVSYGIVREENAEDLKDYRVLLAGGAAKAATPEFVAAVRKFVAGGGKLILLPLAFTVDARTYAATPEIRAEMEKLAAATLDDLPAYSAKNTTSSDWPAAMKIYQDALKKTGVTTPGAVATAGGDVMDTAEMTLGVLKGKGYWLAGIASFDAQDRAVTLTLSTLPAGNYEVVDVTGERPFIKPDAMAGYALAGDPEYRHVKVLAKSVSAHDLATKGVANIEVKAGMGRILLVRPAGETVRVDCPEYEVRTIALRSVGTDVVVGAAASPSVRAAAQRLVDAIKAAGNVGATHASPALVTDADVKIAPASFDAIVHPEPANYEHKIAEFRNAPLDTTRNLVVIGSAATNPLIAHFEKSGTFTYDKVFEKVTPAYPGAGRGVIAVVESVNDPSFDPTDQTRDALLVGGSDDAGTVKAVDEAIRILRGR